MLPQWLNPSYPDTPPILYLAVLAAWSWTGFFAALSVTLRTLRLFCLAAALTALTWATEGGGGAVAWATVAAWAIGLAVAPMALAPVNE